MAKVSLFGKVIEHPIYMIFALTLMLTPAEARKCTPVDDYGSPCISIIGQNKVKGFSEYIGIYVSNSCNIGLFVTAHKNNGSVGSDYVPAGRSKYRVDYCKLSECGGYSTIEVSCPENSAPKKSMQKKDSVLNKSNSSRAISPSSSKSAKSNDGSKNTTKPRENSSGSKELTLCMKASSGYCAGGFFCTNNGTQMTKASKDYTCILSQDFSSICERYGRANPEAFIRQFGKSAYEAYCD